ncbi:DUF6113 family protein [Nocardioides alkalitolerans]|uniref:DUF6113 family protein n=1 Tax=Nocardioides alkalitolerans TaxID=281714 RepID=UPI000400D857|nr:DUF6113 family protein [Nocardioides alkalitolerans]
MSADPDGPRAATAVPAVLTGAWWSTPARRSLAGLGLAVAGALTGFSAVVAGGHWWGVVLAAAATVATLTALPPRRWTRSPYALGWVVPVVLAAVGRPEGDYALGQNLRGYAVLGLAMVVAVAGVVALAGDQRPSGGRRPAGDDAT